MDGMALLDMAERLVSISDLSKGKAGYVFEDLEKNNNEYIILKNNQPKAVLVSIKEYREIQDKIAKLESILETRGQIGRNIDFDQYVTTTERGKNVEAYMEEMRGNDRI